jgi:hypothetical protein
MLEVAECGHRLPEGVEVVQVTCRVLSKLCAISRCAVNVCAINVCTVKVGVTLEVVARSGGSGKVWRWWEALDAMASKVWRQL